MAVLAVRRCRSGLLLQKTFFICIAAIVLQGAMGRSLQSLLTPPAGNSVNIRATTVGGVQTYICRGGNWRLIRGRALLVDSSNSSISIGKYNFAYSSKHVDEIGTWLLNNSEGVIEESGQLVSEVSGSVIAFSGNKFGLPAFLAQASSHRFEGTASLVSYIQQIPIDGDVYLKRSSCTKGSRPLQIPLKADYWFWTQDQQPPPVPVELSASGRIIEGFFGIGQVEYTFDDCQWQQTNITARMYDVPGGTLVGRFFIKSMADEAGGTYTWKVFGSYGFTETAKATSSEFRVDASSLPWRLFNVTSGINESPLGPVTQVQMLSTRGGGAPTSIQTKRRGDRLITRSSFSANFWFYTTL